jgi:hypothetical protein
VRARGDLQEVLDSIDDAGRIPLLRYLDNSTSSLGPYLNNSIYPSAAGWNSAGTPISSKSDQWCVPSEARRSEAKRSAQKSEAVNKGDVLWGGAGGGGWQTPKTPLRYRSLRESAAALYP